MVLQGRATQVKLPEVEFDFQSDIDIKDNSITNFNRGVLGLDMYKFSTIEVEENEFIDADIDEEIIDNYNYTAINFTNTIQANSPFEIEGNEIENSRIGVRGMYTDHLLINSNVIEFNQDEELIDDVSRRFQGVWMTKSSYANIVDNTISRGYPEAEVDPWLTGIWSDRFKNSNIANNFVRGMADAMRFDSDCGATELACNIMFQCIRGIDVTNATISDQGDVGDPWDNEWYTIYTASRDVFGGTGSAIDWYHQGAQYSNFAPDDDQNTVNPSPGQNPGTVSQSCTLEPPTTEDEMMSGLIEIVEDSSIASQSTSEVLYQLDEYLYEVIEKFDLDTGFAAEDSLLSTKLNSIDSTNIPAFYTVDSLIKVGDIGQAAVINSAIITANNIESNKKDINNIIINVLSNDTSGMSLSDSVVLSNLAYLDPDLHGEAVFSSRAIMFLEVEVTSSSSRILEDDKNSVAQGEDGNIDLVLMPNPGTDLLRISVAETHKRLSNAEIVISSTFGLDTKVINVLDVSSWPIIVDMSSFPTGVYFVSLILDGSVSTGGKWIKSY